MAELIIPGTFIEERAEGLISAAGIATGVVGVVGTASAGPIGVPVTLSNFAGARDNFGLPDDFQQPEDGAHPLTLVRAIQFLYNNGASTVIAVRAAGASQADATFSLLNGRGESVGMLTAETPGTWANSMQVLVEDAPDDCRIQNETQTSAFTKLKYSPIVPSAETRIRIPRGATKRLDNLDVLYKSTVKNQPVPATGDVDFCWRIRPSSRSPR